MKSAKHNLERSLSEIHEAIVGLKVEEDLGRMLLENIEQAELCFKEKNILSVINCLEIIVGKLQTYVIFSRCHHSDIGKLLIKIHYVQQSLIKLPVSVAGCPGPPEPPGTSGLLESVGVMDPLAATVTQTAGGKTTVFTSVSPFSGFSTDKTNKSKSRVVDVRTHIVK